MLRYMTSLKVYQTGTRLRLVKGDTSYLVVNDNFERALHELAAIVEARRLTTDRQAVRQAATLADLLSGTETQ